MKRAFISRFGFDVFGSEPKLQEYLGKLEMPYESGMYTTKGNPSKTAHFVRITDIKTVYKRMVQELVNTNSTEYLKHLDPNTLYIWLTGDKGGDSTKLLLQILNSDFSHSVRFAKLIGIYEGDKKKRMLGSNIWWYHKRRSRNFK